MWHSKMWDNKLGSFPQEEKGRKSDADTSPDLTPTLRWFSERNFEERHVRWVHSALSDVHRGKRTQGFAKEDASEHARDLHGCFATTGRSATPIFAYTTRLGILTPATLFSPSTAFTLRFLWQGLRLQGLRPSW